MEKIDSGHKQKLKKIANPGMKCGWLVVDRSV